MTKSFFQSLEKGGVEYLLISGQAAVLYGAATFSEDIDLWVNPTPPNCRRFLESLRAQSAHYYKLTPPFELAFLLKGHGFHFIVPGDDGESIYLDVMGVPPRTGSFKSALDQSLGLETDFGVVPTISIKDLVEIKKTQRLEDYPVISKLVLSYFGGKHSRPSQLDIPWAVENIFTLSALKAFADRYWAATELTGVGSELVGQYFRELTGNGEVEPKLEETVDAEMQSRMRALQKKDREYWKPIISELKQLRTGQIMLPENTLV